MAKNFRVSRLISSFATGFHSGLIEGQGLVSMSHVFAL